MKTKFFSDPVPPGITDTDRARKFLQAAWLAIEFSEMRNISQDERSQYLGIASGTWINWMNKGTQTTQIESVLRLLERLPDCAREELVFRFARLYPTIESGRLAHEPAAVSQLHRLLDQRQGLTLIQGGNSATRTFTVTALGHSMKHRWQKAAISGVDASRADWFVPVEGVSYLSSPNSKCELIERAAKVWPKSEDPVMMIFNGVWNCLPDLQREIVSRAKYQHVIVADATSFDPERMPRLLQNVKAPVHLLQLREGKNHRIHVEFHIC